MGLRLLFVICCLAPALRSPAQFSAMDRHAFRAPDSLSRDLPALVAYLVAPAKTDEEKARSLYVWVLRHLSYDQAASRQDKRINQSVGDILQRRRGTCFDYAKLYEALCQHAGLNCRMISGYARPRLESTVGLREPDHAWNAVLLDGEWRLLDATWGDGGGKDEWSTSYGHDYFLPPPEYFLLNHLPANPVWQLLEYPVDTAWFHLPASRISISGGHDETARFAFKDSIDALLSLPPAAQAEREAGAAYRFYPTPENRRQWAHALIDQAVALDERSEGSPLDTVIGIKAQAIAWCAQASSLDALYDWQKEFYIGLLLDQAVAFNQREVPAGQSQLERSNLETSRDLLLQARAMLEDLPQTGIFREYAAERCRQFLEVVEYNLGRL